MAFIEILPTIVTAQSGWNSPTLALGDDNAYAYTSSGVTPTLWLRGANPNLPKDVTVTGIEVLYSAKTSGSVSNAALTFNYFLSNSLTNVATAITTTALASAEASGSVGGSSNLWGYALRRPDLQSNQWFGVSVRPASAVSGKIQLDDVKIRVHYTQGTYLVGSRSVFSTRENTEYDVIMNNGIPDDTNSLIPRKYNNTTPENQIKSEDVNLLGDALYQIETAILTNPNAVRSVGSKIYLFAVTVTGNVAASGIAVYAKINLDGSESHNVVNMGSVTRTKVPNIPNRIDCHWTSAVGWVVTAASGNVPIYAQSQGMYFEKNGDGTIDFWISASTVGRAIYSSKDDYELHETVANAHQNYIGAAYSPAAVPAGTLYLKILAIGREN